MQTAKSFSLRLLHVVKLISLQKLSYTIYMRTSLLSTSEWPWAKVADYRQTYGINDLDRLTNDLSDENVNF